MEDTKEKIIKKIEDKYDEVVDVYKRLYFPDTFVIRDTAAPEDLHKKLNSLIKEYVNLTECKKSELLKELKLECEKDELKKIDL